MPVKMAHGLRRWGRLEVGLRRLPPIGQNAPIVRDEKTVNREGESDWLTAAAVDRAACDHVVGSSAALSAVFPVFFRDVRAGCYGENVSGDEYRTKTQNTQGDQQRIHYIHSPKTSRVRGVCKCYAKTAPESLAHIIIKLFQGMLALPTRPNNSRVYNFLTHLGQRAPFPKRTTSTVLKVTMKSRKRLWFFT